MRLSVVDVGLTLDQRVRLGAAPLEQAGEGALQPKLERRERGSIVVEEDLGDRILHLGRVVPAGGLIGGCHMLRRERKLTRARGLPPGSARGSG